MGRKTILFCNYGEQWLRGQEIVLLDILDNLNKERFWPVVWSNSKLLCEEVGRRGLCAIRGDFELFFTWSSGRFSPSRYIEMIRGARDIMSDKNVALVHCNGMGPCQWLLPAARLSKLPLVCHVHTTYLKRNRLVAGGIFADHIVAVSHACAAPFLSDGVPSDKISVIYNGIDATALRNRAGNVNSTHFAGTPELPLLMVASLVESKGFDVLFDAMRMLRHKGLMLPLSVIGDGSDAAKVQNMATDLPVAFLGGMPRDRVLSFYKTFRGVLLLPSKAEGLGMSLLEAAAFGIPAIVTNVGGMPEFVQDGITGRIVPTENSEALANAILDLAQNPSELRRLGEGAMLRVATSFSIKNTIDELSKLYDTLIQQGGAEAAGNIPRSVLNWYKSKHI